MSGALVRRVPSLLRATAAVVAAAASGQVISKLLTTHDSNADALQIVAVMSGTEFESTAQALRTGSALAVMGGIELDLRQARLDPAGATLVITACFGGIEVTLPAGWSVEVETSGFGGGVDQRLNQTSNTDDAPRLRLCARAWLGGIEIRDDR